ncbi:peptide chain release factor N(5)-glutamine methyltransferase [candidate division NPL-UPA2 bacterium]|nr:peptide chain release factor N(5)-glutamine methyltransferase [candidate division NPL-UPA2 bacterium]
MAAKSWRLIDALRWGSKHLERQGIERSRLEAQLLLQHVLNQRQDYLYLNSEELLSAESLSSFRNLIERREKRIPWQYLTCHTEFMSLDFLVSEEVMIPRPETELLVEVASKRLLTEPARQYLGDYGLLTVIDMGTGCGNIAIALAKALPVQVYALDISEAALRVARVNAERLDVEEAITFFPGDIFALSGPEGLSLTKENAASDSRSILRDLKGKVDLIISNPPYVATRELSQLQPEVSRFEPQVALNGGEDGLKFYPPLIEGATVLLCPGGYLALEMGINQAEIVRQLIVERNQFHYPEVIKDYSGIERVLIAQKQ